MKTLLEQQDMASRSQPCGAREPISRAAPEAEPSAALKPCPFCGEAEELYPSHRWPGGGEPYAIDCLGCGIDFVPREGMDVVAAWNRRAQPEESHPTLAHRLRRLRVTAHLIPSGWVIELAALIALVCLIAELTGVGT